MSKHNYTQYSNKKNNPVAQDVEEKVVDVVIEPVAEVAEVIETPVAPMVQEPEKKAKETVTVTGTVIKCAKLNVRAEADVTAEVVCVLDAASEIEINVNKSNSEWFSVCTATGIEGYCMRKFIQADL